MLIPEEQHSQKLFNNLLSWSNCHQNWSPASCSCSAVKDFPLLCVRQPDTFSVGFRGKFCLAQYPHRSLNSLTHCFTRT